MKPVVIIGAPRSGTNMLRDALTSLPGIGTWPCDEINYIWRHGNVRYPSDEIPASLVTPYVRSYIRRQFDKVAAAQGVDYVVEKTCANSLRVPFVDAVLPDAKYVFIYRDGIDATGSAKLRWTAGLDMAYILEKVRFVPLLDLPYYGLRYFWSRVYRFFSKDKRLAFWGPQLDNMQDVLARYSLNEVCALQWQRCVDLSEEAFAAMPPSRVHRVKYEDFVAAPTEGLRGVLEFLETSAPDAQIEAAVKGVSAGSVGKGRRLLGEEETRNLDRLVGETLGRYGY